MRQTVRSRIIVVFALLPITLFYTILMRELINIPLQDDYDALLGFAIGLTSQHGLAAKMVYLLGSQHNEYKLFFEHALVWLQLGIIHHISLTFLCLLGDSTVLLLAILLWKMFQPANFGQDTRLALFLPALFLLFQLQYYETLNWAMAVLQNLPVVLFALLAIYLLLRPTRRAFGCAAACLILSIASSANGLVLIAVGFLMLLVNRRYIRGMVWLGVSFTCLVAYAYHYNVLSSQSPVHRSIFAAVLDLQPLYMLAFLGSIGRQLHPMLAVLLGAGVCIFFVFLAWRGYASRSPAVAYSVLFLVITAVGVAGLRSDFGLTQSQASRYNIYSALIFIFAWFAFIQEFPHLVHLPLRRNRIFVLIFVVTFIFSLAQDAYGWHSLAVRDRMLANGMVAYEQTMSTGQPRGPILPLPHQSSITDQFDIRARRLLTESIAQHTYVPPVF